MVGVPKPPMPSPNNTATPPLAELPLAVAKSRLSSPLKSAVTTSYGLLAVKRYSVPPVKLPAPSPRNIPTWPKLLPFNTARSRLESSSKRPVTPPIGILCVRSGAEVKPPDPSPRKILTLSELMLDTARSIFASSLNKPEVALIAPMSVAKVEEVKLPDPSLIRMVTTLEDGFEVVVPLTTAISGSVSLLKSAVMT